MKKDMRVMTERPLHAETPVESLRSWSTDNGVFFKRNQGQYMESPISLSDWKLTVDGLVERNLTLNFEEIKRFPKWKRPIPWNVLYYGNNGIREHSIHIHIKEQVRKKARAPI